MKYGVIDVGGGLRGIYGVPYFDGGLADPVPLEWAFAHGCAAGYGGTTRLSRGRGSWSDRALSASSPRTASRECPP